MAEQRASVCTLDCPDTCSLAVLVEDGRLPLRIADAVAPGVPRSYKAAWLRTSGNGRTVSALAPATHADLCEGACYNHTRVDVAAA